MAERRVACTKIIQCNANAQLLDLLQYLLHAVQIIDCQPFRHFQCQVAWIDPRLMHNIRNRLDNVRLKKLYNGQIDIDFILRVSLVIPTLTCPAGFLQHMAADGIDQSQIFRKRYEIRR